jgi:SPP1 family holin
MNIKTGTIARTICAALAIINTGLQSIGVDTLPFTSDQMAAFASGLYNVLVIAVIFWKNNSFTPGAILSDKLLRKIKSGEIPMDKIDEALRQEIK